MEKLRQRSAKKKYDSKRSRADILQSALEEFAEKGFERARLRDIAARVGLTHGNIRYHYKTKDELWLAAVEFLFKRLDREIAVTAQESERLARGDREAFREWLRKYVYYCARHPEHARIMLHESVAASDRLEIAINRYMREGHSKARLLLETLKKSGVFPKEAPSVSLLYIITGACQNMFAVKEEIQIAHGYDCTTDEAVQAHAETIVNIFCPIDE
ncbi:MAG: TetR/AcrR family transcriptional regulator [Erythrobacter sp.]|uniref:TetR/AcrR family transcriptional regulator n=1 Tax=Erythrobacter sp. TaxID=1042 RepID=UPI002637B6D3|nr:TetR/AcrR family transcriptional regulator [Erythrobacter sp.]MDJ0977304.1 TetR/AcrR family transcriptional regulator [Erythrobacter sp.]